MNWGKQPPPTARGHDFPATESPESSRPMLLTTLFLALTIIAGGTVLYNFAYEEVARNATEKLAIIAELDAARIESWLRKCDHVLRRATASPGFTRPLQGWLQDRNGDARPVRAQLAELSAIGRFSRADLYDADGSLLLTTGQNAPPTIHGDPAASGPQIDALPRAGVDPEFVPNPGLTVPFPRSAGSGPQAWIRVVADDGHWLSRMLQHPPGSSRSIETLLVPRGGEDIVFPTGISQQGGPARSPGAPAGGSDVIAAQFVGGAAGLLRGIDYRDRPSLFYDQPVPGTPWTLIARIDADEVFSRLNALVLIAAAIVAPLFLLTLWAIARRQSTLIAGHRREIGHLMLSSRYETLVRHTNDCSIIMDEQRRIIDVNNRCTQIYGYSTDEMLALSETELMAPGEIASQWNFTNVDEPVSRIYETNHRRKDGSIMPVEISEVAFSFGGEKRIHKMIRDISERKASAAHITQLSRLSRTLSAVNHAIARGSSLDEVFVATCRACVEHGGFKLAWIGRPDGPGIKLRIDHAFGQGAEELNGILADMCPHGPPAGCQIPSLLFGRAAPSDWAAAVESRSEGACDRLLQCELGASVSLPITRDGQPLAVLTAYHEEAGRFDAEARHLLEEIADELSFAERHFAEVAARLEYQEALRSSREQLLRAEELARLGHWESSLDKFTYWSPQMYRLFERNPALGPAMPEELYARYAPDSAEATRRAVREAITTGQRTQLVQELRLPGGGAAFHLALIVPIRNERGRTIALHGTLQDISEQKRSEAQIARMAENLARSAREYEDLYQNAPCGYHTLDANGTFLQINDTELGWLGYERQEIVGTLQFSDLLPPDRRPQFRATFRRLLESGELQEQEETLICKNRSELPLLINTTLVRNPGEAWPMVRSTAYNMVERKKVEREKRTYAERVNQLSHQVVRVQEEERRRLAASLHDRTSPNLAAIGINLSLIRMTCKNDITAEMAERLQDIRALVEDTTANIRDISAELRPPMLDYLGLVPALQGYIHRFSKRAGIDAHFEYDAIETKPEPEVESLLFRVIQEALTNCAKHANARNVEIRLKVNDGKIRLSVADDGVGFSVAQLGKEDRKIGLGLINMREMTEFLGGLFAIESSPGHGTTICIEI